MLDSMIHTEKTNETKTIEVHIVLIETLETRADALCPHVAQ
jgi:hypothetical protein